MDKERARAEKRIKRELKELSEEKIDEELELGPVNASDVFFCKAVIPGPEGKVLITIY